MTKTRRYTLPIILLSLFLVSCSGTPIATLRAAVSFAGDTTGENSASANINFTSFTQPPGPNGNDTNLRMLFTNPEGDTMQIVLAPVGGTFPTNTKYDLDGATNTFEASFTVTSGSGARTYTVSTTNGFLNLYSVNIVDGYLKGISADFRMNFDSGGESAGTGDGTISYSN
ncbi:MAG TPA: hypothetical protein VI895_13405 [Bdellovibrionota bacterium]|nr:hypothetical protein [Bdellovibrionota bacterium]